MRNKIYLVLIILSSVLSFIFNTKAMIFDNRYFPLYVKPKFRNISEPSNLMSQTFFMYADRSFGTIREIGLPEINGIHSEVNSETEAAYNQSEVARSIVVSGRSNTNPLRSDLQNRSIPWDREGIMMAEGLAFYWEQAINCNWSFGLIGLFMNYSNSQEFLFNDHCLNENGVNNTATQGEKDYLFLVNQRMSNLLNLQAPVASQIAFGDVDFYLRLGDWWEYTYKFRKIDAGIRLGGIIPSAPMRDINNPASLPIGGNGHWGIYGAVDAELELREDLVLGLYSRISKRFPRTCVYRMPALKEPSFYGSLVGQARVNPGVTFAFAPYGRIECLREALGFGLGYTLVVHQQDKWTDLRIDQTVPANLENVINQSKWRAEYLTISAFYDFSKFKDYPNLSPILMLTWDMPMERNSRYVYQTNSVSLILQINF